MRFDRLRCGRLGEALTEVSYRHERVRGEGEWQSSGLPVSTEELEMALYLIAFNDEWVPDLTLEKLRERGRSGRALIEEMTAAGVFVFSDGGLDASTAVCSVDPSSGSPIFTDGQFVETKEHLGGYASSMCPTMPRRGIGPAGSRSRSAGRRGCTASRTA